MKNMVKLLIVIGIWITAACLSAFKTSSDEVTTMTLSDAIAKKVISGEYKGMGGHSGNCIKLNAVNLDDNKIKIIIPAGTMFKPGDDGAQNIVVPQEQFFTLNANEKKFTFVKGFCCEASDKSPSKDETFALSSHKDPKMGKLFAFLKGKNFGDHILQESIWCISNNHNVSDVYADNMTAIKPLREELCKITGQKDTWYNTPKTHTVDADGFISHETTEVNGLLKFKVEKTIKLHNEIYDSEGKMLVKNPNEFTVNKGNVEYEFGIRVKGWTKGTYFVKVFENEKVIHTQEFKI